MIGRTRVKVNLLHASFSKGYLSVATSIVNSLVLIVRRLSKQALYATRGDLQISPGKTGTAPTCLNGLMTSHFAAKEPCDPLRGVA